MTAMFRQILGIVNLYVEDVIFDHSAILVHVRPTWRDPRCSGCGKRARGYDRRDLRTWRHLSLGKFPVYLLYARRRVECRRCGIRVELVPWAVGESRFSEEFEELVAYLAQITDKTQVTRITGISWKSVGAIAERVVTRKLDPERLDDLELIGVDEFSYRKYHRYITTVVDHQRQRVVWAAKGRSSEILEQFFDHLGPERCAKIRSITMDMSAAYINAAREALPNAEIVFDRFHVQQLVSKAVDEVRRTIVRELKGTEEARAVKKTRFILLKRSENLTAEERRKLSEVQKTNRRLYRAYLLKETLTQALEYSQPWRAEKALKEWLAWASRSRLEPFVKAARTLRQHLSGVTAYIQTRLTNGLVEGLNGKLRMIARRAYGFHSAGALISMLFLTCGGVELDPPLPPPTET